MALERITLSLLAILLAVSCQKGSKGDPCPDGHEGCACGSEGYCEDGLTCTGDICTHEAVGTMAIWGIYTVN